MRPFIAPVCWRTPRTITFFTYLISVTGWQRIQNEIIGICKRRKDDIVHLYQQYIEKLKQNINDINTKYYQKCNSIYQNLEKQILPAYNQLLLFCDHNIDNGIYIQILLKLSIPCNIDIAHGIPSTRHLLLNMASNYKNEILMLIHTLTIKPISKLERIEYLYSQFLPYNRIESQSILADHLRLGSTNDALLQACRLPSSKCTMVDIFLQDVL